MLRCNIGCLFVVVFLLLASASVSAQVAADANLTIKPLSESGSSLEAAITSSPNIKRFSHPAVNRFDRFAQSIDVSEQYLVAGAAGDDSKGAEAGTVYVFRWENEQWVADGQLFAEGTGAYGQFGRTVAVSNNYVVVAARDGRSQNKPGGVVYVFGRTASGWSQEARLTASDALLAEDFGAALDVFGDRVLIGACKDDENGNDAGAAYIFEKENGKWFESSKLIASNGTIGDHFGRSVALSGDFLLVGAVNALSDGSQDRTGKVYVFHRDKSGWYEHSRLEAENAANNHGFGIALAIDGKRAIIGSGSESVREQQGSGAAYIFERHRNEWRHVISLSSGDRGDQFGHAVDIRGGFAAVGAPGEDGEIEREGAVYLFRRSAKNWHQIERLNAGETFDTEALGIDVALNSRQLLAGVSVDYQNTSSETGAVWAFDGYLHADSESDTSATMVRVRESNSIPQATFLASGTSPLASHSTSISYGLSNEGWVSLKIYNSRGKIVRTLVDSKQPAGIRSVSWDGRDAKGNSVADGTYVSRLETASVIKTQKITVGSR